MKNICLTLSFIACAIFFTGMNCAKAQTSSDALVYMESISMLFTTIMDDTWDYTSTVAHSKSAKKIDSKRKDLLETLDEAKNKISRMPDFEGDASYRDTVLAFLTIDFDVLNNDYSKIVDMEELAESSYDMMEAYLLAQEIAGNKLDTANSNLIAQQKVFAEKHNINIIDNEDKVSKKLESSAKVFKYYNKIYLIFFKSYKQDAYLWNAITNKDLSSIEQNKNALLKSAMEGLALLDSIKAYKSDIALMTACKKALIFYKSEAVTKLQDIVDYYICTDKFDKINTAFEAKDKASLTQAELDEYNSAVEEVNKAGVKYNTANQKLTAERNTVIEGWNTAGQTFLDKHVPQYK
ncbi:MAG: hypothetical protein V1904_10240 [Bacteroidota bacterium]